jgi:hypothetical protein
MRHGRGWIWKRWFGRRRGSLGHEWTRYVMWLKSVKIILDARRGSGYVAVASQRIGEAVHEVWSVGRFEIARRMRMKKKQPTLGIVGVRHLAPVETNVLRDFMPIVEHLSVVQYDDGDARKVGRVTLCTHGSIWQADVKDADTLQQMRVSAPTLDELLALLSRLLSSEEAPWEPDTWAQQQQKKNKK